MKTGGVSSLGPPVMDPRLAQLKINRTLMKIKKKLWQQYLFEHH